MSEERQAGRRPGDLDPIREPERWEALVRDINRRAGPELERRRGSRGILDVVAAWSRPAVAAAASVVLLTAGVAALARDVRAPAESPQIALADALVPETYAAWLSGESRPTVVELVAALEEVER